MTKKHFKVIADIIKLHASSPAARIMALEFANAFEKDNPRFKKGLFLDACGLQRVRLANGTEQHITN
jgi:hypothetical protein|tara:strand:+ start:82 stop:282 length:201 start_codon:yes stop_codon:yes gene_type:complete